MTVPLAVRTLVDGLDHPEGVARGPDGRIWAGGEAGQLYAIDWDGTFEEVATTSGFVLGLALDLRGRIYACDLARRQVLRVDPAESSCVVYSEGCDGSPMVLPNYPVFDLRGNLYVSDSGEWGRGDGLIFRVAPGGETSVWSREASEFPNQMCLDSSGEALLVVETTLPGVSRIPIEADGRPGARQVLALLEETVPDGIATGAGEGEIFVSCYRPDRIYRVNDGSAEVVADDPQGLALNQPTSLAFAGPGLDHLVIANLGGWHIGVAPMTTTSGPVEFPALV